jgi:hypothetical protein
MGRTNASNEDSPFGIGVFSDLDILRIINVWVDISPDPVEAWGPGSLAGGWYILRKYQGRAFWRRRRRGCCQLHKLLDRRTPKAEGGIAKPMAERIAWGNALLIEVAVVDVQALTEGAFYLTDVKARTYWLENGNVGFGFGNCIRKMATWSKVSKQNINQRVPSFLSWQMGDENTLNTG